MRHVLGAIDKARDGYVVGGDPFGARGNCVHCRRRGRRRGVGVIVHRTPQSFLPDEDQGAIFAALRLPEGASINRTGGGQAGGRHRQADPGRLKAYCRW